MEEKKLIRGLGLIDATSLVVGSMIGSGVFIVPSIMAGIVQSPLIILALFIVGGILTVFGALSYGELDAADPRDSQGGLLGGACDRDVEGAERDIQRSHNPA